MDRGWHYAVDPNTGAICRQPDMHHDIVRFEPWMKRGWHYDLDKDTGAVVRVRNVDSSLSPKALQ